MTKTKYDFIVIGGGVLGTFHAYHAALAGYKVALIERGKKPQGASVQNFGQVVPSGMNLKWQKYGRKSLEIYKMIQQEFDITLRQNGSVYIASNEEELALIEELAVINRENDYPSELWTAQQCIQRYEGLKSNYCVAGLFFPEEITLEPRQAVSRIQDYLIEKNLLKVYYHTLASHIEINHNECVVRSSDHQIFYAERVLVCSGYEFQVLFPEIFEQSELQWVKLQMMQTVAQPTQNIPGSVLTGLSIRRYESFSECPSYLSVKAKEDPDSLAKKWGVHILFKQASDGSVIIGDTHEYADVKSKEPLDFRLNEAMNHFMMDEALKIFDLQDSRIRETWMGTYAQCKNADIFKHGIDNRIHLLTGIGGKGMTAGAGYAAAHFMDYLQ
jgi:FAD dependent oxidoreductase TIGR03364